MMEAAKTMHGPSTEQYSENENRFTYHPPKGDQTQRYESIRSAARQLDLLLCGHCPASRELSTARTKLEEAAFWANAAIARNE